MPTLKSRTQHPPGSFQFVQPETGQRMPFVGSFDYVVAQVMTMRRGNRALSKKFGWATDRAGVEYDVEQYNVQRCIKHGWLNFLTMESQPAPPAPRELPDGDETGEKKNAGSVVGAGRQLAAGVKILLDWLGSGGKPVEIPRAEGRAMVCSDCPQNNGGDWKAYFTKPVAEKIRQQLEMKNQMRLVTPSDEKLTVCGACDCPLQLKVWTPLAHISKHTDDLVRKKLDPRCWILHEEQGG